MKTVELTDATASLSEYARVAKGETVVVTQDGKPAFALMALPPDTDLENLTVTTHPTFRAIMERSETRYEVEGGLSTEEVRQRLVARRKAARAGRRPAARRASSRVRGVRSK